MFDSTKEFENSEQDGKNFSELWTKIGTSLIKTFSGEGRLLSEIFIRKLLAKQNGYQRFTGKSSPRLEICIKNPLTIGIYR